MTGMKGKGKVIFTFNLHEITLLYIILLHRELGAALQLLTKGKSAKSTLKT